MPRATARFAGGLYAAPPGGRGSDAS